MRALRRALGVASRRLERPELLYAFDAYTRMEQRDALGIAAVLAATLHGDSTYVDVGSNRGQVLSEAVRVAPGASQIAFEPIPALAAGLRGRFPGVDCREMAVGAEPAVAQFCHFKSLDGWSGLRRSPEISDEQGQPELIDVEVSTLDIQLEDLTPSVIKIDVEGAELDVLRGGRALLARAHPLLIFEHVPQAARLYGAASAEIWELLEELGYRIFAVTGEGPFDRSSFAEATHVNWLARPEAADQSISE